MRETTRERAKTGDPCPSCGCVYQVERSELQRNPSTGKWAGGRWATVRWCQDCGDEVSA